MSRLLRGAALAALSLAAVSAAGAASAQSYNRLVVFGDSLSDNGNLVTICFEGGGRREVNVEGDSEAALILDVIRRVLY